jgi:hypothetical protein
MKYLCTIIAVILLVGLPVSAYAQESDEGTINGQVVNGTEGGGSVAGVEITLIAYIDDAISGTRTTIADGEGNFQFDNVAIEPTYLVLAKYMDVGYYYMVVFESGETTKYVEVGVCDVTTSDQAIRASMVHTVVDAERDNLQVTEVYRLVNDSDMTYVGTDGVLVFVLPEGAYDFEAPPELMMDYQLLDDNKVTYLVPFPPGERQLIYSYKLAKPNTAEYTLPLKVNYAADRFEIMVAGEDIEVTASQLAPADPVVTETGERYIHFRGENIPRSTTINLSLSSVTGGSGFPLVILWIIIALVVAGTAVYLIRKKRRVDFGG